MHGREIIIFQVPDLILTSSGGDLGYRTAETSTVTTRCQMTGK